MPGNFSGGNSGGIVESQDIIGLRKFCEEASAQHGLCAANGFLSGLANQNHGAAPAILELNKHARRAKKNGHVQVMAARVHNANFRTVRALGFYMARVRQAGILHDGKRIHVGSNVDGRTGTILEDGDDAVRNQAGVVVLAEMIGHFVAEFLQLSGDQRGRLLFLRGELRVFVKMFVGGEQRRLFFADALIEIALRKDRYGKAESNR